MCVKTFYSTVMQAKQDTKVPYSKKELEEVPRNLKIFSCPQIIKEWSYPELLELITTELVRVRAKRQTKTKNQQKPKALCDKEVQQAIK